jgi:hypothetical protein
VKMLVTLVALAASFPALGMSQAGPTPLERVEQYERIGLSGGIGLARQVAGIQDPALLQGLERQLRHPHRRIRADAALGLRAARRAARAIPALLERLDDAAIERALRQQR